MIQLINSNRFTTTCLIFNKNSSTLNFFFFRSFLILTLSLINNVFIICFQVTEFNWISLQAGLSHNSQLSIFLLLWFFSLIWLWIKMLIISVPCESIRSNSGCAMLLIAKINKKSFTYFPRNILNKIIFCQIKKNI